MSIFGRILSKIFPGNHPAVQAGGTVPSTTASTAPATAATATATSTGTAPSAPAPGAAAAAATGTPAGTAAAPVDVEAVLKDLAAKNPGPANWRTSIVDLMKLLQLDSDLASRKELAT